MRIRKLRRALAEGDSKATAATAKLLGVSSANLGAERLTALCEQLATRASSGENKDKELDLLLWQLEKELTLLREALTEYQRAPLATARSDLAQQ